MGGARSAGTRARPLSGRAPYLRCGGQAGGGGSGASSARREAADCSEPRHPRIYLSSNLATVDFSTQSKDFTAR